MVLESNLVIRRSLKDLARDVFGKNWFGRERELVSLYAFAHLLRYCRAGQVLSHPTQIVLDGAVSQIPGPNRKPLVCKDLVIWPEPGMTSWNEDKEPVRYSLVVMQWKVNVTAVSHADVNWLCAFSRGREIFVGDAVCLDFKPRRFRLCLSGCVVARKRQHKLRCSNVLYGDLGRQMLVLLSDPRPSAS